MNRNRIALLYVAALWMVGVSVAEAAPVDTKDAIVIERGRYLTTAGGCGDCHTPLKMGERGPEPDMSRMLSGHPEYLQMPAAPALPEGPWMVVSSATNTAWAGPWGTSFVANITPDMETGIGKWSADDFIYTIRSGRHLGRGRQILPPMPVPAIQNLTDEDLTAIYAYLMTVPPIENHVPVPIAPGAAVVAVGN